MLCWPYKEQSKFINHVIVNCKTDIYIKEINEGK